MDQIKLRLQALERRVFGYPVSALDLVCLSLGYDNRFSQSLALMVEEAVEAGAHTGVASAANHVAAILRTALGIKIVVENALDHTTIVYVFDSQHETALADLSDANGLTWRSAD